MVEGSFLPFVAITMVTKACEKGGPGMRRGCPFGSHRVLEPEGVLPQAAWRLDNSMEIYDNEILLNVEVLNIDAASFTQLKSAARGDLAKAADIILDTVKLRGKQHNPVTGSGGMLIGTVAAIGEGLVDGTDLRLGDKVATLVSLSLTPLKIERIKQVYEQSAQVEVAGQAILFASGIYAKLPADLPDTLALAILDVAGAPAQTARLINAGDCVVVLGGGGKSGLLCLYEARRQAGSAGKVIGVGRSAESCERMRRLGAADIVLQADVSRALPFYRQIERLTAGQMADVVINCVDIPGTEPAAIMAARQGGTVYFFSMATSFTAAALGAEGIGKDVTMMIGNGYCSGHAETALQLLRESGNLRRIFSELYAR